MEEEDFGLFKRYDGGVTSGVIYTGSDNIAEYPDDNEVRVEQLEESFHSLNSDSSLSEIHGFELEDRQEAESRLQVFHHSGHGG